MGRMHLALWSMTLTALPYESLHCGFLKYYDIFLFARFTQFFASYTSPSVLLTALKWQDSAAICSCQFNFVIQNSRKALLSACPLDGEAPD